MTTTSQQVTEATKSCPFCGTEGDAIETFKEDLWWQVACDQCGGRGGRTLKAETAIEKWEMRAALSVQREAPGEAVPEGWKLVPVEPTKAMHEAGECVETGIGGSPPTVGNVYRAMLGAAPEPKP